MRNARLVLELVDELIKYEEDCLPFIHDDDKMFLLFK